MTRLLIAFILLAVAAPSADAAAWPAMPPGPVVIHENATSPKCFSDQGGCIDYATGEIYLAPGWNRFIRMHELGHLFDMRVLTDSDRAYLTGLLGMTGPWDQGTGPEHGAASPREAFADAYANCAIGARPGRAAFNAGYAYRPTVRQHQRICFTIRFLSWYRGPRD